MRLDHSKPTIEADDIRAVTAVLRSRRLVGGALVPQFERAAARALGLRDALAVDSGTAALHLALVGLKVGRGDEVILPSYVHASLLDALSVVGAAPVLVDVEPEGFSLSLAHVKRRLTRRTKLIIAVHMFGEVVDLRPLVALGVPVLEDCSHALGATYRGRRVGSFGRAAAVSLFATKLITTGHGGVLASPARDVLARARSIRDADAYKAYQPHFNYQMSNLEGALGLTQLRKLPRFLARRRAVAAVYHRALGRHSFNLPASRVRRHAYYRFLVRVPATRFARIQAELARQGIEAKRAVFRPIHQYLRLPDYRFPHTMRLCREGLSLPIYPTLQAAQARRIAAAVSSLL
ncbi:MAG: DegT/DnrJ/EryC1/StrS family aminotransferase [Candidatus Omnitrophica bacterium]|nr:DegT/DnrJ/EryC1/StrS family aminotransferase [Candidatus Omnitrophota bacterium]